MLKLPCFSQLPKAVVVDLDGTLFNCNSEISPHSREIILRVIDAHIPFIVVTARPERTVKQKFGVDLAPRCTLITLNGAMTRSAPPLKGAITFTLPSKITQEIVNKVNNLDRNAHFLVELNGFDFARGFQSGHIPVIPEDGDSDQIMIPLNEALQHSAGAVFIVDFEHNLGAIKLILEQEFGDEISVIVSNQNHVLSVLKKGISKQSALTQLLGVNSILLNEVIAFGDDLPDMEVLTGCGYSVAMANAAPEVIAATRYQTLSNDEDGVALVLEKMLEARESRLQNQAQGF